MKLCFALFLVIGDLVHYICVSPTLAANIFSNMSDGRLGFTHFSEKKKICNYPGIAHIQKKIPDAVNSVTYAYNLPTAHSATNCNINAKKKIKKIIAMHPL